MNATRDFIPNEVSQKDKYHTKTNTTYTWNLKYDTDEPVYKTEIDVENRLVVTNREVGRERKDWEFGINR